MEKDNVLIPRDTLSAIVIILNLFSEQEKKSLEIIEGDTTLSLAEQLLGRGGYHVPVLESVASFKYQAARIKAANKPGCNLLVEMKKKNIFDKLLDPFSYKQTELKLTKFKGVEKRIVNTDSESAALARTLGRTVGGTSGVNKAYTFSQEWDEVDRKRLDRVRLDKDKTSIVQTETGEEDDTIHSHEDEIKEGWITRKERMDNVQSRKVNTPRATINFDDGGVGVPEREISIFDASINQSVNAASTENSVTSNTFVDNLKRQGYETTRETMVLADALNKIKTVDFMDVHEKLLEKFDVLFKRRVKCQSW